MNYSPTARSHRMEYLIRWQFAAYLINVYQNEINSHEPGLFSNTDNMAFVGILSTQLVVQQFIEIFRTKVGNENSIQNIYRSHSPFITGTLKDISMVDQQNIQKTVREFIQKNFIFDTSVMLADNGSLLGTGVIDSTGVLELIGFLEEKFQLTFDDNELVAENFDTILKITAFLQMKLEK